MIESAAQRALDAAWQTDTGRVRDNNEDLPIADAARGVFGVIDGVGGSVAGEVAAAVARDVILHRLSRPLGTPVERVREAIALANNEIYRRSERAPGLRGMTCVVTLAIVNGDRLTIGHVGDSRLYLIGPTGIRKLTHDHSPVGEREDAKELSELDAMRHPRRNELYRDVGSALHDKDEDGFVEVIDAPWQADQALLVCTDGLTDMLPSTAIERLVRHHAGQPQRVVDALVDAANAAGGSDNVTVVYAEGVQFAAAARAGSLGQDVDTAELPESRRDRAATPGLVRRAWRRTAGAGRWVVASRTTWFAVGALVGVLATLALFWRTDAPDSRPRRTLVAGGAVAGAYATVTGALEAARSGDVVQLEPGIYTERIVVPEGVDLVSRVPGTVTFRRAPGTVGPWIAVTADGAEGGRLRGFRIESTPDAPVHVGVRVAGQGRTLEMLDIVNPVEAAIDVAPSSSAVVQASVIEAPAACVRLGEGARALLQQNLFTRAGRGRTAPLLLAASVQLTTSRNVFSGFGPVIVEGAGGPIDLSGNFVLGPAPGGSAVR